ncbi:hypothetical protein DL95DRAFT_502186 [Leptodontidium sp. 2 PMI_412]|nr:hypothetical protein DL95DRAFT_502186 [Leptodontidium sp. 2 PMI_412]
MQELGSKLTEDSMAECPKIVKILVSPGEIEMTCHKAALGFHSDFFDAAFYGGMAETTEGVIRLPEESKEGISTFISWVCSGQIRSSVCAEELWVLGDKPRSPKFCNEVMCFIIGMYGNSSKDGGRWLSARSMDFIYEKATETSSLMLFARHLLRAGGPLCPRAIRDETKFTKDGAYEKDWRELIKRGGDLVLLIAFETSFFQDGLCEFLTTKKHPGLSPITKSTCSPPPPLQPKYILWRKPCQQLR